METNFQQEIQNIFGTNDLAKLRKIAHNAAQFDAQQKINARGAGRKLRFDENDVANMITLREQGTTVQEIATHYHTSRQTITQYLRKVGTVPQHPDCLWRLNYMNGSKLCTAIYVDFRHETIAIQNYTDKVLLRAFGVIEQPTWQDFELFLQDRCLPQSRINLKWFLKDMGLDFFDPFAILEKTHGRMAGDDQWLQMIPINRAGKAA